jgi:hypothetical protein
MSERTTQVMIDGVPYLKSPFKNYRGQDILWRYEGTFEQLQLIRLLSNYALDNNSEILSISEDARYFIGCESENKYLVSRAGLENTCRSFLNAVRQEREYLYQIAHNYQRKTK